MAIARHYFPNSIIKILTNGVLLNEINDDFWISCNKYNIKVKYTNYIKCENYPKDFKIAEANAKKYNVNLKEFDVVSNFYLTNLSPNSIYDKNKAYDICLAKIECSSIDNGYLYACSMQGAIKILNNYFKDRQIPLYEEDRLNIYKIKSIDEILEFYKKPKNICAHCGFFMDKQATPWHHTEKIAAEWYKM